MVLNSAGEIGDTICLTDEASKGNSGRIVAMNADVAAADAHALGHAGTRGNACYVRFDHATGKQDFWDAGPGASLAECCFPPKSKTP